MFQKSLIILLTIICFSCEDEESGTPLFNLKYRLHLPVKYNVDIQYFSDKYYDTRILEKFNINHDSYLLINNEYWEGKHIQNDKKQGYFIQVNFNQLDSFDGDLKLYVFANDSIIIDSASFTSSTKEIILKGDVPQTF